jgi:hypothetical protein
MWFERTNLKKLYLISNKQSDQFLKIILVLRKNKYIVSMQQIDK